MGGVKRKLTAAEWESSRADVELLQSKAADPVVGAGTRKLWCFPICCRFAFQVLHMGLGFGWSRDGQLPAAGAERGMLQSPMGHPLGWGGAD